MLCLLLLTNFRPGCIILTMKRIYEIAVLSKGAYARTLRMYVPKKADRAIIMHDGQNVFCDDEAVFKKSMRAAEALRALSVKNTAIIGIDCAPTRLDDYMPIPSELTAVGMPSAGGHCDRYADFIEQTVIPYLDTRFKFKKYGMLGTSAGGAATLYFASRRLEKMIAYAAFSVPLFFGHKGYAQFFSEAEFIKDAHWQIYVGGDEHAGNFTDPALQAKEPRLYVNDAFMLVNELRNKGISDVSLTLDAHGTHDEESWRKPQREFFEYFAAL